MKKYWLVLLLLSGSLSMAAQRSDYKVVFDLTSRDILDQKNLIRWLTEISNANPEAKMEVVMYAKGLEMVVKDKSIVTDEITRLSANKNISFKVCAVAMKNTISAGTSSLRASRSSRMGSMRSSAGKKRDGGILRRPGNSLGSLYKSYTFY